VRGIGQLDVVQGRPVAHLLAVVGAEVVEDEVQPRLDGMQRADVAAELQELDAGLALLDVPVEPVGADVMGGDEMPDAVRALVVARIRLGFARGAQPLPPGWGCRFSGPNSSR
jgi:hypothetical protein